MCDCRVVVSVLAHERADEPRVMEAAGAAPVVIAAAAPRVVVAGDLPTAQMLRARRDLQKVGGVRVKRLEPRAHALA